MSDNNTTRQPERWQIMARDMSPGEIESKRVKSEIWFMVAAFTAFFASSFFVVKYMVGGDFSPTTWTGEQWGNAFLGLLITAVITAFQYYLYSIDQKTAGAIMGALIAVFFGLFSEISQSMEREDATVRHRSEASPVFQAALSKLGTLGSSNGSEGYAALIAATRAEQAAAETALSQCQSRYKGDYSRNKCKRENEQAIAAAQAKIASYNDAGKTARADKSAADKEFIGQLQGMQYDEQQHYAMIRLIREFFGVAAIWASFLFSFAIIGTFEYAFHFIGSYLNDLKKALRALGYETGIFKKQPARSPAGAGAVPPAPGMAAPVTAFAGAADAARQTIAGYAGKAEASLRQAPEAVGNELMKAQAARDSLYQGAQEQADKLADKLDKTTSSQPVPEQRKPPVMVDGFDMVHVKVFAPTDEEIRTGRSIRQRLREGERIFPGDKGLDTPPPPSGTTVPDTVRARSETVPDTVRARSQNGHDETVQNGLTDAAKQTETDLYPDWISRVSAKEISPGARDCKRFISQQTVGGQDKAGITVTEMGRIWLSWQGRAVQDGILKPNPDYSNGKPKYILA